MAIISTTETTNVLLSALGAQSADFSASSETTAANTAAGQSDLLSISEDAHTLILKDKISSNAQMMAFITISGSALDQVSSYLSDIKDKTMLVASGGLTEQEINDIQSQIVSVENEMSSFIGALYHDNNLDIKLQTYDGTINSEFLDVIDLSSENGEIIGNVSAIEVNFAELISSIHTDLVEGCPHCASASTNTSATNPSPLAVEEALETSITSSTAGYQTVSDASGDSNQSIIDTLLLGTKWDIDIAAGETLTYSYYDANTAGYDPAYNAGNGIPVVNGPSEVNSIDATNETNLNTMFQLWDDVLDIDFVEVDETGGSDVVGELRVAFTDQSSSAAAFAYQPGGASVNGDIWFESEDNTTFDPTGIGSAGYSFRSALHETGHAIGLSHPFSGSVTGQTLASADDIMRNTFMSYTNIDRNKLLVVQETVNGVTTNYTMNDLANWTRTTGSQLSYGTLSVSASTPMPYDILAAQFLYGAATDTRTGDNTYSFDVTPYTIQTIYDSDGTDTIDASNQTNGSTINLEAGSFSSIGVFSVAEQLSLLDAKGLNSTDTVQDWLSTAYDNVSSALSSDMNINSLLYTGEDNVAIAYGVAIENAYGGSGNDTITGNNLNNLIIGNGGDDTIDGGTGDADIVKFTGSVSDYTITTLNGVTTVVDGTVGRDGTDTISNVEFFEFTGQTSGFMQFNATLQNFTSNITFDLTVDGVTQTVNVAARDYTGLTLQDFANDLDLAIDTAFAADKVSVTINSPLAITSNSTGAGSGVSISNATDATLQAALGITDATGGGATQTGTGQANGSQYYNVATGTTQYYTPSGAAGAGAPGGGAGAGGGGGAGAGGGSSNGSTSGEVIYPGTISSIDLTSKNGAIAAISIIDRALETIGKQRASFGAIENRLDHAMDNMGNQIVHAQASKSRISDADFAVEMSKFVKAQVLQQAAMQVLGRSQQNARGALGLLQG